MTPFSFPKTIFNVEDDIFCVIYDFLFFFGVALELPKGGRKHSLLAGRGRASTGLRLVKHPPVREPINHPSIHLRENHSFWDYNIPPAGDSTMSGARDCTRTLFIYVVMEALSCGE